MMNGMVLGNAIVDAIKATDPTMTTAQINQLKTSWIPVATAIVSHIETYAVVTSAIPASSIITVGSPSTQTGPQAPVDITGSVA